MADFPADGRYAPHDPHRDAGGQAVAFGTYVTWVGAALSVAMVAGIGLWGYQMVMRDVSGVPVVRAMSGETRRQPEAAGGKQAEFQGLSVNHVAAEQGAEPPADTVRLAPAPLGLGDEAGTGSELVAARAERPASEPVSQPDPVDLSDPDKIEDLAAALATGAEPLSDPEPRRVAAADPAPGAETGPADPDGILRAVRPRPRPDDLLANVAARQVAGPARTPERPLDVAPGDVPAGTRLAQLGAFASQEIAEQEWDRFRQRFGIYMEDKQRVIQRASSGGRIFYRLRVLGFDDLSDSRRFCAALVAEGADCIPVSAK